jgi:hypothetical protein
LSFGFDDELHGIAKEGGDEYNKAKKFLDKKHAPVQYAIGEWLGSIPSSVLGNQFVGKATKIVAPALAKGAHLIHGAIDGGVRAVGNDQNPLIGAGLGVAGAVAGKALAGKIPGSDKIIKNLDGSLDQAMAATSASTAGNWGRQIAPHLPSPKEVMADEDKSLEEQALAIIEQFEKKYKNNLND